MKKLAIVHELFVNWPFDVCDFVIQTEYGEKLLACTDYMNVLRARAHSYSFFVLVQVTAIATHFCPASSLVQAKLFTFGSSFKKL